MRTRRRRAAAKQCETQAIAGRSHVYIPSAHVLAFWEKPENIVAGDRRDLFRADADGFSASRPPYAAQKTARCACRDAAPAQDRVRRFPPEGDHAARLTPLPDIGVNS